MILALTENTEGLIKLITESYEKIPGRSKLTDLPNAFLLKFGESGLPKKTEGVMGKPEDLLYPIIPQY